MPLGNLTSQFFANVYLNELDYFVKHKLKAKYYIRYVDDFVILDNDKKTLEYYFSEINNFLMNNLKLELHPYKSKIVPLSIGITFLGYRIFYHYKLLRKTNIRKFKNEFYSKLTLYKNEELSYEEFISSLSGWLGYSMWADTYKLRSRIIKEIGINKKN